MAGGRSECPLRPCDATALPCRAKRAGNERLVHEKLPRAVPFEEENQAIAESAPALLSPVQQKLHPGFRELLSGEREHVSRRVGRSPGRYANPLGMLEGPGSA